MTLRQLQIFIVVAERRNLRVAAEELRIAQSSISQHLRLLQEEFGKEFYRKVGGGIELTPAGISFLRKAKSIIDRLETLKIKLRNFPEPAASSLTVGGNHTASVKYLPFLLALFRQTHENVRLKLRTDDGWTIAGKVLTGEIDIAVVHDHPGYKQLIAEPCGSEEEVACVGPRHPLAKTKRLTLEDMRHFGFVIRRPHERSGKSQRFIETFYNKFRPKVILECDTSEAKKSAIKNHMGIGTMFKSFIQDDLKSGELVELALPGPKLCRNSFVIYRKDKPLSSAAQDFLQLLRSQRGLTQDRPDDRDNEANEISRK